MVTADTNVAFYALASGVKANRAEEVLASAAFLSVQVLNEYAAACRRKLRRSWTDIARDVELLKTWVGDVRAVEPAANNEALRLAERYQIPFYDALLLAVALANGATVFYSEDLQNGMLVDGTLRIIDPFDTATLS